MTLKIIQVLLFVFCMVSEQLMAGPVYSTNQEEESLRWEMRCKGRRILADMKGITIADYPRSDICLKTLKIDSKEEPMLAGPGDSIKKDGGFSGDWTSEERGGLIVLSSVNEKPDAVSLPDEKAKNKGTRTRRKKSNKEKNEQLREVVRKCWFDDAQEKEEARKRICELICAGASANAAQGKILDNYRNNYSMVEFLLDHGVDPNIMDRKSSSPVFFWVTKPPVLTLLLSRGAAVNRKTERGTILHYLMALCFDWDNQVELVKICLEYGASVNKKDSNNQTPLHILAKNSTEYWRKDQIAQIAQMLFEKGITIDSKDSDGYTAIDIATQEIEKWQKRIESEVQACEIETFKAYIASSQHFIDMLNQEKYRLKQEKYLRHKQKRHERRQQRAEVRKQYPKERAVGKHRKEKYVGNNFYSCLLLDEQSA